MKREIISFKFTKIDYDQVNNSVLQEDAVKVSLDSSKTGSAADKTKPILLQYGMLDKFVKKNKEKPVEMRKPSMINRFDSLSKASLSRPPTLRIEDFSQGSNSSVVISNVNKLEKLRKLV